MKEPNFEIEQLSNNWESLCQGIKKNNKISLEVFSDTFSKTYQLLVQKATEQCIEKNLLALIINASLFAHLDISKNLDSQYKAALVLTERMLNAVMAEGIATPRDEAIIYIFELRKEVCVNFNDVSEALDTLKKLYEADFWGTIQK